MSNLRLLIVAIMCCAMCLTGCVTTTDAAGNTTSRLDFEQLVAAYELAKMIYTDLKNEGIISVDEEEEQVEDSDFFGDILEIVKIRLAEGLSSGEIEQLIRDLITQRKAANAAPVPTS